MQLRSGKIINNNINININKLEKNIVLRSGKIINSEKTKVNKNKNKNKNINSSLITNDNNFYENIFIKKEKGISVIYTKNKINLNSIFPNNNIKLPESNSIYFIDLKPLESFKINLNDINYIISFIKFYLDVVLNIYNKKKYSKNYESKIFYKIRIITYINFIYNFIHDNISIIENNNNNKDKNIFIKFITIYKNKANNIIKDIIITLKSMNKHNFKVSYELDESIKQLIYNMIIIDEYIQI